MPVLKGLRLITKLIIENKDCNLDSFYGVRFVQFSFLYVEYCRNMKYLQFVFIILVAILFGCKTEEKILVKENPPIVVTMVASQIALMSATLNGEVAEEGFTTVTDRGFVYSDKNTNPSITDSKIQSGYGKGVYSIVLDKLLVNTKYYYKAYAINTKGTSYGDVQSFTTTDFKLPNVITNSPTNVTSFSAEVGGSVIDGGGLIVTQRGIYFGLNPNPSISDNKVLSGEGLGTFAITLTNLKSNSKYYVRAFAVNSKGIDYGNEVSFNTSGATGPRDNRTIVKEVKSKTGRIWMDRNLGAGYGPILTGGAGYGLQGGDLYQWGRGADGHQLMNWTAYDKVNPMDTSRTTIKSKTDTPGHSKFIVSFIRMPVTNKEVYFDWRETINNNLWQGVNGINNPCPLGFRLPTWNEWQEELKVWGPNDGSILDIGPISPFFTFASRNFYNGEIVLRSSIYWSSTVFGGGGNVTEDGTNVVIIPDFKKNRNIPGNYYTTAPKGLGGCVRCIKD